jgi:ectoine hydroxylase-related dioxygenase (phytanoyl-CoA dioxygenase family)
MVKHPGDDTEVPPHQDWIVADESERPTMNVWFPLTPVTAESGIMRVLPGSHRWLEGLRGSPTFPTQWEGVYQRVRDELMVEVPLRPGQGMVYDIRILHGTPPNRSQDTRVVTSLYATPVGARKIHYYRDPSTGTVTGHEVPVDFCTTFRIGDVPEGPQFTEIVDYSVTPLSFEELAERYRAERASVGAA